MTSSFHISFSNGYTFFLHNVRLKRKFSTFWGRRFVWKGVGNLHSSPLNNESIFCNESEETIGFDLSAEMQELFQHMDGVSLHTFVSNPTKLWFQTLYLDVAEEVFWKFQRDISWYKRYIAVRRPAGGGVRQVMMSKQTHEFFQRQIFLWKKIFFLDSEYAKTQHIKSFFRKSEKKSNISTHFRETTSKGWGHTVYTG